MGEAGRDEPDRSGVGFRGVEGAEAGTGGELGEGLGLIHTQARGEHGQALFARGLEQGAGGGDAGGVVEGLQRKGGGDRGAGGLMAAAVPAFPRFYFPASTSPPLRTSLSTVPPPGASVSCGRP